MFENLPLGFRFRPTDVELIDHYLRLKINGKNNQVSCIKEVDICKFEPWDLPDMSAIKTCDPEWFFFCPRDPKYGTGLRSNRATEAGYWKATGKDRTIKSRTMGLIGMKKTLVFYLGRAPKGQRTNWVIHEYRPTITELDGTNRGQNAFVLCRLFKKYDDLKQNENDNVSNVDEMETLFLSPNKPTISEVAAPSKPAIGQASPVSVEQPVVLASPLSVEQPVVSASPAINDGYTESDFDFLFDSLPIHQNDPFCLDDLALTERNVFEDADLIGWNEAPINENGSYNWADIQVLELQSGCEISDANTDDNGIFSGDAPYQFWKSSLPMDYDNYDTGNKIQTRSNYRSRDPQSTNIAPQGTASRRIHFNKDDNNGTVTNGSSLSPEFDYDDYLCLDELNGTPPEAGEEKLCVNDDQVVETGIKVTTHLRKTNPNPSTLVEQEAPTRIRLRRSFVESYNAEEQVDSEEEQEEEDDDADNKPLVPAVCSLSEEVSQKSRVDLSDQKLSLYKWSISAFLVAFLIMACIGLWKAHNVVYS